MSTRGILGAMVAGSVLILAVGARGHSGGAPEPEAKARPAEEPWLDRDAAAQLFGENGQRGPLFKDVEVGGAAPAHAVRARIAQFAREHHIDIDLEIVEHEVAAIEVGVTYSGCCGYEGADVLALRLGRPQTDHCCGCEREWIDNWGIPDEAGTYMRARVSINKVNVRWTRTETAEQMLEHADKLIGADIAKVREAAGDGWRQGDDSHHYRIDVPYPFAGIDRPHVRDDLGVQVTVDGGKIVEVSFARHAYDEDEASVALRTAMVARWGRSRKDADGVHTWRTTDRVVTGSIDPTPSFVTIAKR